MQLVVKKNYLDYGLFATLSVWFVYSATYVAAIKFHHQILAGYLSFIGETGLDIIASAVAFALFLRSEGYIKVFFGLFSASFFISIFSDGIYNYLLNILQYPVTPSYDVLWDVPFALFLVMQTGLWFFMFRSIGSDQGIRRMSYFPYVMASLTMFSCYIIGVEWRIHYDSTLGMFHMVDTVSEVIGFVFASFCLVRSQERWINLLSVGYLLIIASDFIIRYSFIQETVIVVNPFEMTWVLGELFIAVGLISAFSADRSNEKALSGLNNIGSQSGVWVFSIFLLAMLVFITVSASLSLVEKEMQYINAHDFPAIVILFSIISAILSNVIAKKLSYPINRIRQIIEFFNADGEDIKRFSNNNRIVELHDIQDFITNSLSLKNEKYQIEREFSKEARQVAHDIKSPLVAIQILSQQAGLKGKSKTIVEDSIAELHQISSRLLDKYKQHQQVVWQYKIKLNSTIEKLIAEKRLSLSDRVKIQYTSSKKQCDLYLDEGLFKRVISNLLNNAIEALSEDGGCVDVNATFEDHTLKLSIRDNGCGIPPSIINAIVQEGFTYGKEEGTGLGLSFVVDCIKSWGGEYEIQSELGVGTTFLMRLPVFQKFEYQKPESIQTY